MNNVKYIPLSDISQINPQTDLRGIDDSADVSFIPMADVSESGVWINHQTRSVKDIRNGYTCFQENDILFAKITPCMENGKGAHAVNLLNGVGFGTTEFHVLRANSRAYPRFIYYWTMDEGLRRKAEARMTGSAGQRRVPADFFCEFKVPFLPLPEQRRIAEILDTIDEALQKTETLISKLRAMKQGLLHDLLTRGLDKDGKLRDPKTCLIPFSDVVQVNPTTELHGLNDETDVSFIPMSDVSESGQWVNRQTRPLEDIRNGYTCFRENDVLFAKITPCMENGKGGHAIGLVNGIGFGTTEFHVLRASVKIEPRYIYHWTMTEELRRKAEAQMTGSAGQRRVPTAFFDNFKIPLFPRSEQRKIVEILDAHDARIRIEEQYRDKLKLQKKGLMHDLLTGKVRVKHMEQLA